jgi:hypothetical protein
METYVISGTLLFALKPPVADLWPFGYDMAHQAFDCVDLMIRTKMAVPHNHLKGPMT